MSDQIDKLNQVVDSLEAEGVTPNDSISTDGVGDKVARVLNSVGVTPEAVENWLGIKECGCKKRQKFLNGVLSFLKNVKVTE